MPRNSYWPDSQSWRRYWPAGIIASIAVIQLFVSFIVVGIHTAIVIIGIVVFCIGATPWYIMGFVCWIFFFACWISIFCVTCCNRSSVGCATYVMIKNILAFIFAAVLIDFDRKFIAGEAAIAWISVYTGSCGLNSATDTEQLWSISISLAKGQLAGAVIILVSSLVFVGIYAYVYIRAVYDDRNMLQAGSLPPMHAAPQHGWQHKAHKSPIGFEARPDMAYPNNGPLSIICPNCGTPINRAEQL